MKMSKTNMNSIIESIEKTKSIRELLYAAVTQLTLHEIPNPRIDAEILLAHVLNVNRMDLYINLDETVGQKAKSLFIDLLNQRQQRIPAAYLIGYQEFMGLRIQVNQQVLIPRPETEAMVEYALNVIKNNHVNSAEVNLLDFGTGSGAIACACAAHLEHAQITACDRSKPALQTAEYNSISLKLAHKISFIQTDTISRFINEGSMFDMIISNPPYIKSDELDHLQAEVRCEPRIALDGGVDGMDLLKLLIDSCGDILKVNGYLIMEIDPDQAAFVVARLEQQNASKIVVRKDYAGFDRIVSAQY
ncbi:MAG: peptide chain release factor N(5)-glutamine methyltransferase [bacterium]